MAAADDKDGELLFTALGGVGEIGMNVYLYGLDGQWMMVDLGITFADDRLPGADIVLPDLTFIEQQKDRLKGLVLTHAHEDHLGAVPYLWPRLNCPIYCSPFAAAVLKRKLDEAGVRPGGKLRVVEPGELFKVGPFSNSFISVTHSVPEANALAIECERGRLLHSGDWKLDPMPLLGKRTDARALEEFGDKGALALISDSTNVLNAGTSGSESEVRDSLTKLIAEQPNRVVLTTFASNIARMQTAIHAAREAGREVFIVGRSMNKMMEAARDVGYLGKLPPLRDLRELDELPRNKVMLLATGSQGEPRAALVRIASNQHPKVKLDAGDTVIFSSKIIPGNERTLYNLHNLLVTRDIEVITEEDHFVHVSGHPCRDEMEQLYRWIRPEIAVPMHGEARHLHAHQRFAQKLGVPRSLLVENGSLLRLAPGIPEIIDEVPVGRMVFESEEIIEAGDELYRTRRRLMNHGTILVSLVFDDLGSLLSEPRIAAHGLVDAERLGQVRSRVVEQIMDAVEELNDDDVDDDDRIRDATRFALRQALDLPRFRRPLVEIQILRLSQEALAGFQT
ncbi:MAG: ribonuclease J, partial [Pseudomonadota bacterium]